MVSPGLPARLAGQNVAARWGRRGNLGETTHERKPPATGPARRTNAWHMRTKALHPPSGYHSDGACQAGLHEKNGVGAPNRRLGGLGGRRAPGERRPIGIWSLPTGRDSPETASRTRLEIGPAPRVKWSAIEREPRNGQTARKRRDRHKDFGGAVAWPTNSGGDRPGGELPGWRRPPGEGRWGRARRDRVQRGLPRAAPGRLPGANRAREYYDTHNSLPAGRRGPHENPHHRPSDLEKRPGG